MGQLEAPFVPIVEMMPLSDIARFAIGEAGAHGSEGSITTQAASVTLEFTE